MFNPPALFAARWTAERLSKENLEFLRRLPTGPILVDETFAICHGSPLDEDANIFSDGDAQVNFVHMDRVAPAVSVPFFGHSHIPSIFTLEPDGILVEAVRGSRRKLFLEPGKRYLVIRVRWASPGTGTRGRATRSSTRKSGR